MDMVDGDVDDLEAAWVPGCTSPSPTGEHNKFGIMINTSLTWMIIGFVGAYLVIYGNDTAGSGSWYWG